MTGREFTVSPGVAARMAGVSARLVDYWLQLGVIECEPRRGGWERRFDLDTIPMLRTLGLLRRYTASADVLRRVAEWMNAADAPTSGLLVITRDGEPMRVDPDELPLLLQVVPSCWLIDLDQVHAAEHRMVAEQPSLAAAG